jgi:acetyl esterase/lipase
MTRLILIIILFLISLLAVFKAFEYHIWLLAIGVTEFPWLFSSITFVILLTGFWVNKYQMPGTVIGIIALILFLSPIFRAYILAGNVRGEFDKAFNVSNTDSITPPFTITKLFAKNVVVPYRVIDYVKYPDTTMKLDFYPSRMIGRRPCVIVVHGGSWAGGDSQQLPELNSYMAAKGYNVASINYRMAPKWQTPAPVEDIANAIKYLTAHADELHIDPTQFVLLGRSAGAQIALLAAYTLHNQQLKGVIDFYGPADMVWGYSIPSNPLIMDSRKVMDDYVGGSFSKVPMKYYECSPLNFVSKESMPTLIIHGTNDVLVSPEHSHRLNGALNNNGIKHYWLQIPWATHGFDFNLNGPGGQISTYTVMQFLKTVSSSPPTP